MITRKSLFILTLFAIIALMLSACSPAGGAPVSGGGYAVKEAAASGGGSGGTPVQPGTLTAGDIDDNLNYAAFLRYLARMSDSSLGQSLPEVAVRERVTLHILGNDRMGLSNAWVTITPEGSSEPLLTAYAATDGTLQFFPALDGAGAATRFTVTVRLPDRETLIATASLDLLALDESRIFEISAPDVLANRPDALDLMLVIDTTGSMSDELNYLTTELGSIISAIREKYPTADLRFGLVVYRDTGDIYVVRDYAFTDSLDEMQKQLSAQSSGGGGDYPEAVEKALDTALEADWRGGNTARMLFHVADAPPHTENFGAAFELAQKARQMGVRMYPLAASGVADEAEYLMRASALVTQGRYLFLTDDSGVGEEHAEPKVPCYLVTRLDYLMIRVIDSELAGVRVEPGAEQIIRITGNYDVGVCASGE